MEEVEIVVAHQDRATLRVGDVFLKVDADQTLTDVELGAMAKAPIPTPQVLWHQPPVLALAALPGKEFRHPVVGELSLAFEAMALSADSGLTLTAYTPEPDSASAERLQLLATWAVTLAEPDSPSAAHLA